MKRFILAPLAVLFLCLCGSTYAANTNSLRRKFETGNSAISLAVGNIITVTYPELDIDGETFEIIEIEKSVEGVRIKAASYSNDIFRAT